MKKLSRAIYVLESEIKYSVENIDAVRVELDFEDADVILELLKEYQDRMIKIGESVRKTRRLCGEIDSILLRMKAGEQE